MGLFRALVGIAIETVKLPVDVALDVVTALPDATVGNRVGSRTIERLENIKEEADEAE